LRSTHEAVDCRERRIIGDSSPTVVAGEKGKDDPVAVWSASQSAAS
jgi:hypothetical protein